MGLLEKMKAKLQRLESELNELFGSNPRNGHGGTPSIIDNAKGRQMIMKQIITTALCAIISGLMMMQAVALMKLSERNAVTYTDYNDHLASEQISAEWQRQASIEYGDIPRDPTAEELQYMQQFAALKQAEINIKLQTNR
jgi:hypothetical protein|nr:MAG TPA: hypothetical protein [Bacteriophage sp.]